ncbi:hypothetical protein CW362_36075 [Streptomyces populi]|uniref:Uncharacterized protein n=1 Tax=Streptomyces populi TaxID=2058924 RepID=A0A2I0SEB0_9ACTN|nr:hypothetical protein [Streptomyces populi]PKT68222.1 hypothetical protein CW362_36075 [Streptomyces populi]
MTVRPWHVFALGSALGATALLERVQGSRSGRQYVLCHASSAVDHLTVVALALAGGAFVAAVVGAVTAVMKDAPRSSPLFPAACMVAALACVVAADTVDAVGEQRAADIAAQGFHENGCDYPARVYSATPGWFTW